MTGKTAIGSARLSGAGLVIVAGVVFVIRAWLADQPNAPYDRVVDPMSYGTGLLVVASVRCLVFGLGVGKRLRMAALLSLLVAVVIGMLPAVISVLMHGLSSVHGPSSDYWMGDFWMGVIFFIIDFVMPCVVGSVVLAAVPIFDSRFSSRLNPAG